jgi:hypothetical protein
MAPVQRLMMYVTPTWLLNILCRVSPKTAIGLLCHWLNEKNPDLEERQIAKRRINPVPVAKKLSQLSVLSILCLLRQDDSLWKFYAPTPKGGLIINLKPLPYILLELMFDLGGQDGRNKVSQVVQKTRTTIGGGKQIDILRNFKTDTVLELFEMFPANEVNMVLKNFSCETEMVAFWLTQWDLRMQLVDQPAKSEYWLGQIPGMRAFQIEKNMKDLEFRRKFTQTGNLYNRR